MQQYLNHIMQCNMIKVKMYKCVQLLLLLLLLAAVCSSRLLQRLLFCSKCYLLYFPIYYSDAFVIFTYLILYFQIGSVEPILIFTNFCNIVKFLENFSDNSIFFAELYYKVHFSPI